MCTRLKQPVIFWSPNEPCWTPQFLYLKTDQILVLNKCFTNMKVFHYKWSISRIHTLRLKIKHKVLNTNSQALLHGYHNFSYLWPSFIWYESNDRNNGQSKWNQKFWHRTISLVLLKNSSEFPLHLDTDAFQPFSCHLYCIVCNVFTPTRKTLDF